MNTAAATIEQARSAKDQARRELAQLPGVVGIGLMRHGAGYAVKVNCAEAMAAQALPEQLSGVPLVIEVVGTIKPL